LLDAHADILADLLLVVNDPFGAFPATITYI
jgi:hypothetical protein